MKSKYLMIGAAFFAALFLFSGVMLYRQYADEKQSAEAFDNIAALVQNETPPADTKSKVRMSSAGSSFLSSSLSVASVPVSDFI